MDQWLALAQVAGEQHGRIHVRQAQELGIAPATLRRLAHRFAWRRPHPGVFVLPGAPPSHEGKLASAVLAVGEPVLVANWSAAWLWGLVKAAPTVIEVVVPHQRRKASLDGVTVHRSRTLTDDDAAIVRHLPVTSVARTLCDLAPLTEEEALRALVIDARQRRLVRLEEVAEQAGRYDVLKGLRRLRRVLWELDGERCDSVLEWRVRRLLAEAGLRAAPAPVPVDVGTRELHVDIAWPEERVGIEVDGLGSHSERESLETDIARHNALARVGWRVLRAGWREAGDRFPILLADLRLLLNQGRV